MNKRPLAIIFAVVFLDLLGFGIVIPQLAIYAHRFGASGFWVGVLGSTYSAMQFLFAPMLGRLSDRVGRRPVLLISLLGSVGGYLIFGLAGSLAWLFVGRMVQGICGANIGTAQAYIADVTPPEERAKSLGLYLGAAFGLGFVFGPAVGGLLAQWGNLGLGIAAAAMSLCAFLLALVALPESLPPEKRGAHARQRGGLERLMEVLRMPGVGRIIAVFGLATLGFSMMEGVFSLYVLVHFFHVEATPGALPGHDPLSVSAGRWTAAVFVVIGVVSTVVQGGLIGRLRAAFGEPKLVAAGVGIMTLAFAFVPAVGSVALLMAPMGALALGSGINNPSISSLLTQRAPATRQGEVIGVYQSVGSFARTVGPSLGGLFFQMFGETTPFLGAAALMALATVISLGLLNAGPRAPEASVI
ncbi:MAG: MFS transporter [Deltaproteobacteria bacterium]|nr:MFS transporter [Deltaproteobacteria bacterium]